MSEALRKDAFPDWLHAYARKVCATMTVDGFKLKGRGRTPRIEMTWGQRLNPLTKHLPAIYLYGRPLDERAEKRAEKLAAAKGSSLTVREATGRRHALEPHWQQLEQALHACGFDLERNAVVNPDALAVAGAWWLLHEIPLPPETAHRLEMQTLGLLAQLSAEEDRAIVQATRS